MIELATTALLGDVPHGTNSSIVQVVGLQCILSGLGWTLIERSLTYASADMRENLVVH